LLYDGLVKSAHWHGVEPPPGRDVCAAPRLPRRGAAIVGLRRWQLHDGDREPGAVPGVHVRQRVEAQLLALFGAVGVATSNPRCLCAVLGGGASSLGITINDTRALELPGACGVKTPPASQCKCELIS
jgi:hypothetical protein